MTGFALKSAVTAAGGKTNEDSYGIWPATDAPRAAWVLDGVTGINDRALLPGPSDAAWFVATAQAELTALLEATPDAPILTLLENLIDRLIAAQQQAWLSADGAGNQETPAASFAFLRRQGEDIEFARLGDCLVLLERIDGTVTLLDDPVLHEIEADLKARILAMHSLGISDDAVIRREMLPHLRSIRTRRNVAGGYGVLTANRDCLGLLAIDRLPANTLKRVLLVSDGYYRLVDVYGAMSDRDLLLRTAAEGAPLLLAELRTIEANDPKGIRHPRLKMADDATALLLERA